MRQKSRFAGFIIVAILITPLFIPMPVNGQGASLSIFPPVIEVETTPPASPAAPIVIQNNSEEDITLKIELIPFKSNNRNGDIELDPGLLDQGFYPYYKDRIQFLEQGKKTDTITLSALESKEIQLNINVSKGDPPGDYYYSIIFMTQGVEPEETSVSQIPAGIATNLLLSVGPKGTTSAGISEFTTDFFKSKGPVKFSLKLHNGSTHMIAPTGKITISNLFGQKVGEVDVLPQYILAGSDRYLIDTKQASDQAQLNGDESDNPYVIWPENFLFGLYNADARIQLEEDGRVIEARTRFIAFPLYFFFPLFILIFISLSVYLRVKRKV